MSLKHQWYVCLLSAVLLLLTACASSEPVVENVVVSEPAPVSTMTPRHGELIFVEFFAVT